MAVLGLAVEALKAEAPALTTRWAALGIFSADFDAAAPAALWGEDGTPLDADAAQDGPWRLSDIGLVEAKEAERFRLHDLLRETALLRLDAAERERLRPRHAKFYRDVLGRADERRKQGGAANIAAGLALYDREQAAGQAFAAADVGRNRGFARFAAASANAGACVPDLRLVPRVRIGWLGCSATPVARRGTGAARAAPWRIGSGSSALPIPRRLAAC